jgi:tRNA/tmRNA/rRNA uracil-C5-methylase (TrmA/RlmC/RlmD family)
LELSAGPWGNGGVCASRLEGAPVVLVAGAIPGERVAVEVTERRPRYWRGRVVEVLEASPSRVAPPWPEGAALGAADLGHVAPEAARAAKAEVAAGLLRHLAGCQAALAVAPVGDGAQLGWRTKIELAVDAQGRAGMRPARSHQVQPLAQMPLAVGAIGQLGIFQRRWPPGARLAAVAASDGEAFCLVDGQPADQRRFERVVAGGREHRFELAGDGFWQLHRQAPALLAEVVLAALADPAGARVWDLYAGAGLFALPLAAAGAQVTAVERDAQAVADLRANAWAAGLRLGGAHRAAVAAALRRGIGGGRPDAVVLDPPRAGAGLEVARLVAAARPVRVVYVSCEPAALARDLAEFQRGGYQLAGLRGFDLFPGTHHTELVAVLDRA